jgi:hypothetical protein
VGSVDVAVNDGLLEGERVGIIVGSVDDASNDGEGERVGILVGILFEALLALFALEKRLL